MEEKREDVISERGQPGLWGTGETMYDNAVDRFCILYSLMRYESVGVQYIEIELINESLLRLLQNLQM